MRTQIVRLRPITTLFVALVKSTGTSFASRTFKLAPPMLESKTQRLIVIVMWSAPLRQLGLGWIATLSQTLVAVFAFAHFLHLLGSCR